MNAGTDSYGQVAEEPCRKLEGCCQLLCVGRDLLSPALGQQFQTMVSLSAAWAAGDFGTTVVKDKDRAEPGNKSEDGQEQFSAHWRNKLLPTLQGSLLSTSNAMTDT